MIERDLRTGFPKISWHLWVDDPHGGTELYVVDSRHYLSYRAYGRQPLVRELLVARLAADLECGIDPNREETAIVRMDGSILILLGDHRRRLEGKTAAGLALYYDLSTEKCPISDSSWYDRSAS